MKHESQQKEFNPDDDGRKRSLRGFASMDPDRQREIASMGGRATQQGGKAHQFTVGKALAAGKKGRMTRLQCKPPKGPV